MHAGSWRFGSRLHGLPRSRPMCCGVPCVRWAREENVTAACGLAKPRVPICSLRRRLHKCCDHLALSDELSSSPGERRAPSFQLTGSAAANALGRAPRTHRARASPACIVYQAHRLNAAVHCAHPLLFRRSSTTAVSVALPRSTHPAALEPLGSCPRLLLVAHDVRPFSVRLAECAAAESLYDALLCSSCRCWSAKGSIARTHLVHPAVLEPRRSCARLILGAWAVLPCLSLPRLLSTISSCDADFAYARFRTRSCCARMQRPASQA